MILNEIAARVCGGVQNHAAMNAKPPDAPAAAALAGNGLTTPPADAAAARVRYSLLGGRRPAIAWRLAKHSAGAAATTDAASLIGATLRGSTRGGRARSCVDTVEKLAAVGAGTGSTATAGADAAAGNTQSCWRACAAGTVTCRRRIRRRMVGPRRSFAVDIAVEAWKGGAAPLAAGRRESVGGGEAWHGGVRGRDTSERGRGGRVPARRGCHQHLSPVRPYWWGRPRPFRRRVGA